MKQLKIKILSWLLHHANRISKSSEFYEIKTRLLKKNGRFLHYEVQFIEGKKCWSCGGTGIHHWSYDQYGMKDEPIICWSCDGTGWYKNPMWVILKRIQFGRFIFHQPYERSYSKPQLPVSINGYVEHTWTKHGRFALGVLYLLCNRKSFKRYINTWYFQNVIGPIKIRRNRRKTKRLLKERKKQMRLQRNTDPVIEGDLPF